MSGEALTTVPAAGTRVVERWPYPGRRGTVIREVVRRQAAGTDTRSVVVRFDGLKTDQNVWIGFLALAPPEEPDTVVDGLDTP